MKYMHLKRQQGFTLIEIAVVLVIMVIILTYANRTYERYRVRQQNSDAVASLLLAVNDLEKCAAKQGTVYTACELISLDPIAGRPGFYNSKDGFYEIEIEIEVGGSVFRAKARKLAGFSDVRCGHYQLDNLGERKMLPNGTVTGTVKDCWKI